MEVVRQKCEKGDLFWYNRDGGLIFAIAKDGWWGVWPDTGHLDPPGKPPDGLHKPVRGFGKVWHERDLYQHLGWATTLELPGEGDCVRDGDAWLLWFGSDFNIRLEPFVPGPEPTPEPEPEPGPPPLPIVPPPFVGFSRPPELVMLPSGKLRDMAFCVGADLVDKGVVKVRWAYGYYIKVHKGEITLCGETIEHMSGEDAAAFRIAWHLRQGHIDRGGE